MIDLATTIDRQAFFDPEPIRNREGAGRMPESRSAACDHMVRWEDDPCGQLCAKVGGIGLEPTTSRMSTVLADVPAFDRTDRPANGPCGQVKFQPCGLRLSAVDPAVGEKSAPNHCYHNASCGRFTPLPPG